LEVETQVVLLVVFCQEFNPDSSFVAFEIKRQSHDPQYDGKGRNRRSKGTLSPLGTLTVSKAVALLDLKGAEGDRNPWMGN
jgi:hypothetical protein